MSQEHSAVEHEPAEPRRGLLAWWHRTPLYLRIVAALILGLGVGLVFRERAAWLEIPSKLILRLLGALAPPLILIAVIQALMNTQLRGQGTMKLVGLLVLNTLVAITIGLGVANVVQPGRWSKLSHPPVKNVGRQGSDPAAQQVLDVLRSHGYRPAQETVGGAELAKRLKSAREAQGLSEQQAAATLGLEAAAITAIETGSRPVSETELVRLAGAYGVEVSELIQAPKDLLAGFLENIPKSLLGPLGDNGQVIGVIFIAIAFGVALRGMRTRPVQNVDDLVRIAFDSLLTILHWIIDLVPIGVFGIVASIVGTKGLSPFAALGAFVFAVLLALFLQACYYLLRVRLATWVRPLDLIRGTRDALVMAFSTASSTVTMPVTYSCLKDRVGIREQSASMGALVGSNFNNDGTALYEAMSALFIAQMLGITLSLPQQLLVVLTSIVASVGAAGIPEAGLVTMTLVFTAVGLPTPYIALLLTVDWFLDRCRTAINVMGDMNVSCLMDGKQREVREPVVSET